MRVFTCTDHAGHWTVPVASVVIATDEVAARAALMAELRSRGLATMPFTLKEIDPAQPQVIVLSDGDY